MNIEISGKLHYLKNQYLAQCFEGITVVSCLLQLITRLSIVVILFYQNHQVVRLPTQNTFLLPQLSIFFHGLFISFLSLDLQNEISEISIMSFQNVDTNISNCSRLHNSHNLRILYIDHFYRAADYHTQPRQQRDVYILFFI